MFYRFFVVIFIGWLFIMGNWRIVAGAEFTDFGPYNGKIVDDETKEPIEGVVIFIEWVKLHAFAGSTFIDGQETLTDKNGEFYISGIWVLNPWKRLTSEAIMVIYKSGYQGATARWFYKYLPVEYKRLGLRLDDNVYKDYASLLLPRAVGYSAGLINYFFRGKINMEKDPNNSSLYVIKNESDEYMSGTFTLYYDDTTDNRRYLTSWNKSINPNSTSDSVTFTPPTDQKEKGKYILVFKGTMGNEIGAVVGRVVELKKEGIGSVAGVNGNSITVYMEDGGTITGSLPPLPSGINRSRAISVRFDKNDWNIFVVLTIYCDEPDCRNGYYAFHKYSINPDKTSNYHGVVLTKEVFPSIEASYKLIEKENPECDGGYCDYNVIYATTANASHFICVDFSPKDGHIKPFGVTTNLETTGREKINFAKSPESGWYRFYSQNYIDDQRTTIELHGGGAGGGEAASNERIYPLAIFNETDYAFLRYYIYFDFTGQLIPYQPTQIEDDIISSFSIATQLKIYNMYLPSNSYIKTALRDGSGEYSFYQKGGGCGWSYSDSLARRITYCPGVIAVLPALYFSNPDIDRPPDEARTVLHYAILDRLTIRSSLKSYSSET